MELLIETRPDVFRLTGNIHAEYPKPYVSPEPVMKPDRSAGEWAVQLPSVIYDSGRYRMWYGSFRRTDESNYDGSDPCYVGYAESDDAINWRRPNLNLVEFRGNKKNNICELAFSSASVFIDPDSPPSHRYRATGYCNPAYPGNKLPPGSIDGTYTAHSSDGLRWEFDGTKPSWVRGHDNIISIYHPQQKRGLVMIKREPVFGSLLRRGFWEASLRNGQWSPDTCALVPDEYDDVVARTKGCVSGDYYHVGMQPVGSATIGFVAHFRHLPPYNSWRPTGHFGPMDIGLVYQFKPHERWFHPYGRPDFIPHGLYPWMEQGIYPGSASINVGTDQMLHITGTPVTHGYGFDALIRKPFLRPDKMNQWFDNDWFNIGIARWRRDRLIGLHSDAEGHIEIEFHDAPNPLRMLLNCKTMHSGRVYVELLDSQRKLVAKSKDLTGDHLEATVIWDTPEGPVVKHPGGKITIRLHLDDASAYTYDLQPG